MKTLKAFSIVVLFATCLTASAAYTPPTDDQVSEAAADPSKLAALVAGATPGEAAEVVKSVIVVSLGLGLEAPALSARVGEIVAASVGAMSAQSTAFAAALGTSLGGTSAIGQNAVLVAAIQAAVTTAGGQQGAALASSFQTAFDTAANPPTSAAKVPVDATDYGR